MMFGAGRRVPGPAQQLREPIELEQVRVIESDGVTHIDYRVRKG
jgi:hypothetical protein